MYFVAVSYMIAITKWDFPSTSCQYRKIDTEIKICITKELCFYR